jgi:hypothetical protein
MKTKFANQHRQSRNFYGGPGSPLSNEQKARICIIAKEAFLKASQNCTFRNFKEWRRQEQLEAIGKESLRECVQSDYLALLAHFQNLAGESGRAVKNIIRAAAEERAVARNKLDESLGERGLRLEYAEAICKRQFKCDLDGASAKQLWTLNFTVRNRRKPVDREVECPF